MRSLTGIFCAIFLLCSPFAIRAAEVQYVGIGARLGTLNLALATDARLKNFGVEVKVVVTLKDGPADRAGIREGDGVVSIEVDDRILDVKITNYSTAIDMIKKGTDGSTIHVTIMRPDQYGFLRKKMVGVRSAAINASWSPYVVWQDYTGYN